MKVAMRDILNFIDIYSYLCEKEINFKLSYTIYKIFCECEKQLDFYRNEMKKIIEKYGERDDKNNLIVQDGEVKIQEDFIDECQNRIDELNNVEIFLNANFIQIEDLRSLSLTPKALGVLMYFIEPGKEFDL